MIRQYRKMPVTISAVEYKPSTIRETFAFCKPDLSSDALDGVTAMQAPLFIETLEGTMEAKYGDFIIQGVAGEFYPCKPIIFKQTYETVPAEAESTYLTRMMDEYKQLDDRYQTLGDMLERPQPNRINNTEWQALAEQHQHMKAYRQTLGGRIKRASEIVA